MDVDENLILKNEPLVRNDGGKPHFAEQLYRIGGHTVYTLTYFGARSADAPVNDVRGKVFTEQEKVDILRQYPELNRGHWQARRVEMTVYVRGNIRHPDHSTLKLDGWHRVVMNTEDRTTTKASIIFMD